MLVENGPGDLVHASVGWHVGPRIQVLTKGASFTFFGPMVNAASRYRPDNRSPVGSVKIVKMVQITHAINSHHPILHYVHVRGLISHHVRIIPLLQLDLLHPTCKISILVSRARKSLISATTNCLLIKRSMEKGFEQMGRPQQTCTWTTQRRWHMETSGRALSWSICFTPWKEHLISRRIGWKWAEWGNASFLRLVVNFAKRDWSRWSYPKERARCGGLYWVPEPDDRIRSRKRQSPTHTINFLWFPVSWGRKPYKT